MADDSVDSFLKLEIVYSVWFQMQTKLVGS